MLLKPQGWFLIILIRYISQDYQLHTCIWLPYFLVCFWAAWKTTFPVSKKENYLGSWHLVFTFILTHWAMEKVTGPRVHGKYALSLHQTWIFWFFVSVPLICFFTLDTTLIMYMHVNFLCVGFLTQRDKSLVIAVCFIVFIFPNLETRRKACSYIWGTLRPH